MLLRLTEVLDKMLDLESYNEILDMVRQLIDNRNFCPWLLMPNLAFHYQYRDWNFLKEGEDDT